MLILRIAGQLGCATAEPIPAIAVVIVASTNNGERSVIGIPGFLRTLLQNREAAIAGTRAAFHRVVAQRRGCHLNMATLQQSGCLPRSGTVNTGSTER
jgi:hypothetical protein